MGSNGKVVFKDFFPVMIEKLGTDGFMKELGNGFDLLKDEDKGVITFTSLKRNAAYLGLEGMSDDEIRAMLKEGDLDGDGALNEKEFCTLMFRLSPDLMENSEELLDEEMASDNDDDDDEEDEEEEEEDDDDDDDDD